MPRIPREEHATILRKVDVEGNKVAEVAAAYGCTPANIYAILAKQRRQGVGEVSPAAPPPRPVVVEAAAAAMAEQATAADLFTALPENLPAPRLQPPLPSTTPDLPPAGSEGLPLASPSQPAQLGPQPKAAPAGARRTAASKPTGPAPPPRVGKAGYVLLMRTSDGEEAVNPFRSLEELLSAAKPILRTAARSLEPIWFSIQQVDLDTLDDEF